MIKGELKAIYTSRMDRLTHQVVGHHSDGNNLLLICSCGMVYNSFRSQMANHIEENNA